VTLAFPYGAARSHGALGGLDSTTTKGTAVNTLWDWIWLTIVIFFIAVYIMMLFRVVLDIFRNHESSGWVKAGWLIVLFFFPLITMLIYVIVNGKEMAQRDANQYAAAKQAQDDYIRSVAAPADPTAQISQAHDLLTKGAISQAEFDTIKAKALAGA
jgi:heme/copper-type cytochrome/quinol oxidase subunit 2